jgi:hypothetical protein
MKPAVADFADRLFQCAETMGNHAEALATEFAEQCDIAFELRLAENPVGQ